ncbi:MAG TPA: ABC transporter permease [Bacteroidota bacterium]|nr:ABC transporter permease [Bacteroidota bacterium]
MTSKILAVAWWEYSEKIKSKAFIVSLILLPAVIVGLVLVPAIFVTGSDTEPRELGIVDETGAYASTFSELLGDRFILPDGRPNYRLHVIARGGSADIFQMVVLADSMVLRGEMEGYFILRSPLGDLVDAEYRTHNVGNIRLQEKLTPVLREAVTAVKLRRRGIDPEMIAELGHSLKLRTFKVSPGGRSEETAFDQTFFSVYMYMMMLFFIIMTSGQLLVRSMLEEKSNRIVEILLSSLPARDIMGGKILGLGALGVTQLLTWGIFATAVSRYSGLSVIPLGGALLLTVYFILGYLFYSAIFVSAGAPLSTEQEAQQVTSLFSMGLVVPLALSFPVMQDPGSALAIVLTLIPLFTPMMMAIRIPSQMPPLNEIILSLCILGASVFVMMRLAGRIFSASVLLSGKRLSFRELRAMLAKMQ